MDECGDDATLCFDYFATSGGQQYLIMGGFYGTVEVWHLLSN
jgi:hypothetical protein